MDSIRSKNSLRRHLAADNLDLRRVAFPQRAPRVCTYLIGERAMDSAKWRGAAVFRRLRPLRASARAQACDACVVSCRRSIVNPEAARFARVCAMVARKLDEAVLAHGVG